MAWMNEYEIDEIHEQLQRRAPDKVRFAKYLMDYKDVVNANSDGWSYWRAGTKCADRLSDLLKQTVDVLRDGRGTMPTDAELTKALAPIKGMATRKGLTPPVLADAAPVSPRPSSW